MINNIGNKLLGFILPNDKKEVNNISVDSLLVTQETNFNSILNYTNPNSIGGGFFTSSNSINPYGDTFGSNGDIFNKKQKIIDYRNLLSTPEVNMVVNELVNDSIITYGRPSNNKVINLRIIPPSKFEYGEKHKLLTKELEKSLFNNYDIIYDLINIRNNGHNLFRQWLVDGELAIFVHLNETNNTIDKLEILEATELQYNYEYKRINNMNTKVEYYIYKNEIKLAYDAVIWIGSGYKDADGNNIGYLDNAIKFANILRLMEDSTLIYRVSRSPERRIFYIDTGDLPKARAEQYVKEIADRYKTQISYDTNTGKLKNTRNNIAITEDFWLARGANGNSTSIDTLPAGQNGNDTTELDYFRNKLYDALRVPANRFDKELQNQYTPNLQISKDELRFQRLVSELRYNFNILLYKLLRLQLVLDNVISNSDEDWQVIRSMIDFEYFENNYFKEELEAEKHRLFISTYQQYLDLVERNIISREYYYKRILGLSDAEYEHMLTQIAKEQLQIKGIEEDEY